MRWLSAYAVHVAVDMASKAGGEVSHMASVRAVLDDLGLLDDVSEDGGRWLYGALERGPFRFTGTGFRLQEDITPEDFPVPRRFTE